ncbi:TetR/AcrR family transcriptional regulator [Nocardia sp. NPDC058518]|uniref:TetR/AcrR family transcriptional regulator n=1 Tax=Nocardia sp. NPDC058518 TaxID=3346534 RepID=UPI003664EFE3
MSTQRIRRTQAERRSETRRVVLDAAFDTLVEFGFRGTTTSEVAHRAGVSMGALLHHFPAKSELLTAAVGHAFDRRIEEYQESMARRDPTADPIDSALDMLWAMYSRPTFLAWNELWTAARTDPELATTVAAMDRHFLAASEHVFAALFPDIEFDPRTTLHLVYSLMTGLAVADSLPGHRPYDAAAVLDLFKTMVRAQLTDDPAPADA